MCVDLTDQNRADCLLRQPTKDEFLAILSQSCGSLKPFAMPRGAPAQGPILGTIRDTVMERRCISLSADRIADVSRITRDLIDRAAN